MSPLHAIVEWRRIWIFRLSPDQYKYADAIASEIVFDSIYNISEYYEYLPSYATSISKYLSAILFCDLYFVLTTHVYRLYINLF